MVGHRLNSPLAETPNAKDYIDVMCEIRKLGIFNEFEENTPTIVVFGDQSSGKSSVLQRLTGGLPMPRGSTKCTATPFEIRMLQTEEPLRKISLRYIEDKNSKPITPREIPFAIITDLDEDEIEEKLREAQRYVQNPSITDVENTRLPPDSDELAFTKNAVCVTISGPDQMYSLSMVDLPGVVRNDESHEQFVLSLVKEYIKKESAILVPIFQATSDIATQCAYRLAREADPTGQRTVGVLTKMDRIVDYPNDDDKHLELSTLVKGQGEHKLVNGTYVIRNPTNSEMREDPDELEKATVRALKQNRIWREVPSDRFGLQNLTIKLSDLQRKAHERTWPRIHPFLEDRRSEFQEKLNALPLPPDGNPTNRFLELIGIFDKLFTSHANAENVDHKLYRGQQWNFGQFDQALLNTRPRYKLAFDGESINEMFDPIKPGSLQYRGWTQKLKDEIMADNWGGTDDSYSSEYVWELDQLCETVQESQGGQLVGYFPYKAVVAIVAKHQKDWSVISTKLLDKNHDWVRQFVDEMVESIFREFPNAVEEIRRILRHLLKQCKDETLKHLKDLHEMEHMSASRALYVTDEASLLKKQSKYFIKYRILSASSKQESNDLRSIVDLGSKIFDMMYDDDADEEEFEKLKNDLTEILSEMDNKSDSSRKLIDEIKSSKIMSEMPSTATLSMMLSIKNQYLDKLIGVVPSKSNEESVNQSILRNTISEHAFLAATGALAYWKMAHTKFREVIPRIVEYYLVHQFSIRLKMDLLGYFKLVGPEVDKHDPNSNNLKDLLGENPENARNRKEWQEYIDALSVIIDKVRRVSVKQRSGGGSSGSSSSGGGSSSSSSSKPRGHRV
ncbi:unnamed protein product [Rhizophagus irregularis]|uniref:P-loop containing nucleoside triphosphate hydrolase protein n=1 Tax=Rhizophagus irregularis TaxID=588596 RepID=A0A2N1P4B2_9GLOM|nr:hypothetical protein RhiirC2_703747 [Rhizophagus irregularis]CAB4374220.1 unnamed protein product [Rhizophagus irregularis]CAB5317507.1 unnamed protein product [Rhizophagus irregularis]